MLPEELGSLTAKNGFKNEQNVVETFNAWKVSPTAQNWLAAMRYPPHEISNVCAKKVSGCHKADVQVLISTPQYTKCENIQVKLVSNESGFNQIDKRWLRNYQQLWGIPQKVLKLLQYFTGELAPYKTPVKDCRRMFLNELTDSEQKEILKFFNDHKLQIIGDILKGQGEYAAAWVLVIRKTDASDWILKPIEEVIRHYAQGGVFITPRGSLRLGKITVQRKGGDGGRDSAKMLQFKIDPTELFD